MSMKHKIKEISEGIVNNRIINLGEIFSPNVDGVYLFTRNTDDGDSNGAVVEIRQTNATDSEASLRITQSGVGYALEVQSGDVFIREQLDLGASTTDRSNINFSNGDDPSAPVEGDLWYNGTNLYFYDGSTAIDLLASGSSSHNGLTGLQGGDTGEYYHLTSEQQATLADLKNMYVTMEKTGNYTDEEVSATVYRKTFTSGLQVDYTDVSATVFTRTYSLAGYATLVYTITDNEDGTFTFAWS
jgi:hypothetical protein